MMDSTTCFDKNDLRALKDGINELLDVFIEIVDKQPRDERHMHMDIAKKLKTIVRTIFTLKMICTFSVTCVKCGIRSTFCWKISNISGSTELFGL